MGSRGFSSGDLRRAERGDADAYSTAANAPLLFGLLAFGVTIAALGFGRVGAASAVERGAYAAGTHVSAVGIGDAAAHFRAWAGNGGSPGQTNAGRMVVVSLARDVQFGGSVVGRFEAVQRGAMAKRVERFYPGGGE